MFDPFAGVTWIYSHGCHGDPAELAIQTVPLVTIFL